MADGTVKWFNTTRGFGLIVPDDLSAEVFVHFSTIEGSGYRELTGGQRVAFDAEPGPKGRHSTRVRPLEERAPGPRAAPPGLRPEGREEERNP